MVHPLRARAWTPTLPGCGPHHSKSTTFAADLRLNDVAAPMVLDAPMNGVVFLAYVEEVLVAKLKSGDGVIFIISRAQSEQHPLSY